MRKARKGFTIIEVVIFLAITGIIFMAIVAGTRNVMSRQRYNDTTQNFAEFLRGVYSKLTSIENHGDGRSDKAIYGKLITFGEALNFAGEANNDNEIFVYDIIGDAASSGGGGNDVLDTLIALNADVVKVVGTNNIDYAGIKESYLPKWMARVEKTDSHDLYRGSVIIVRSATSGTIYTFTLDEVIEVNSAVRNNTPRSLLMGTGDPTNPNGPKKIKKFTSGNVDFCIQSDDGRIYNGLRRDIRIIANARNSSGVEVMPLDDLSQNACQKL